MKKDGHFIVPVKKTEPVVFQAQETSLQDRTLADFRAAKGLKARVAVVAELIKVISDLPDKQTAANEIIAALNADITSYQRTSRLWRWKRFLRVTNCAKPPDFSFVGQRNHRRANLGAGQRQVRPAARIDSRRETSSRARVVQAGQSRPLAGNFARLAEFCFRKTRKEFASLLIAEGKWDLLKETLARLIRQHTASSELLLWFGRERNDDFADILGPEVFRAMLTAMERDQFNEKRSNRLRDFILEDQELLNELTATADIEVVKDLTRALQLSPVFDDMDKRSLLARLVKKHPAVQSLVSGEQTKQDSTIQVSWESLERRRAEYQELVQKKIPANSKEIAIARSYGDLRENHEYKAAKEMQKILMRRKKNSKRR